MKITLKLTIHVKENNNKSKRSVCVCVQGRGVSWEAFRERHLEVPMPLAQNNHLHTQPSFAFCIDTQVSQLFEASVSLGD